ncbi:autotransporter domain-containing protein, partial [Zavarzinia sp.]|uniref:autotransporter domain-containing protein n=1 Tax=Zavarzinia sp. TaxID=2027920 RepID=UPI0035630E25
EAGVLEVAGDTALGALSGHLTLDGGTLRVLGTGFTGTSRKVLLGAAGGGFDIDDAGNVFTLTQALTGPGGLTKLGDGTLMLTAANSYAGGTTISAGTLVGDSTSLTGDILDNAALIFAQALDGVFAGTIGGTGSVTKNGGGALTLSADNGFGSLTSTAGVLRLLGIDTIAGAVSVTGGSLIADGTLHTTGGVTVGSGAELAGTGTIDGTVNIANGATLSPGGSAAGTLTVGTLNLAPAAIVNFDLAQAGVIGGGINDYVVVNGDLTLDGILNVNATTGQLAPGVYRLFTYSGALDDQTLAYGTVPDNVTYAALGIDTATARQVSLVVDGLDPELAFWNGSTTAADDTIHGGSGTWNADNTNWTNLEGSVTAPWAGKRAVFEVTGGTVTLVGQQAFSGLVFVADGYRLEAGADGALVTSTSAEIQVNSGIAALIAAPITGSGGINKTDGGLLKLEGINTYAGGTLISGGTLEVAQDSALGDLAGGVTLNGGVLRIAGSDFTATTRSITLGDAGGGFDVADAGASFTVSQALGGVGALLKLGDGILRLTGANTYTGGTTIAAGTLIGDTKSIVGTILDNAALAFEQAADGTFAGLVGGTGTVIVRGAGTLTLSGSFGQSGGTLIDGGALRIGAGASLAGDVTDNGTLIFERSDDIAFGRAISGTGEVIKLGSGLLEFTGTSSYTGDTMLQAGTLSVTGSIAGSTVRLASGTLLTGDGAVGGIDAASGSTVDPAATTGTASLSVNGDIKLAAGSTLKIDFDSLGLHDQLKATGAAAIASGALLDIEGLEVVGTSYTILTANEGVGGRFDVLPDDYVFLDEVVAYDPNKVTVSLSRNDTAFASAATTPNGRAAAEALEKLGLGNALYDAVVKADMAEAAKVFATLSGEIYASAAGIVIDEARQIQTAVIGRLQHQLLDTADAMVAAIPFGAASPTASAGTTEQAEPDRNNAFWTAAYGAWGHRDADSKAAAADSSSAGVLFGADTETSGGWTIGLAGGIGQVSADADAIAASADVNSYSLALYGGKRFGRLGLRFGAAYSWQNVDTTRTVTLPATTERLNASFDARTAQVFGDIGYGFKLTRHLIAEPFGDLSYLNYSADGATESGGSAALTVDGQDYSSAYTALGLRVGGSRDIVGGRKITAGGSVAWRHAYGDTDPNVSVNFGSDPASSFTSSGLAVARDAMALDAGVDLRLIGGISVGVNYSGQVSSATQEHGVQANVKIRF